MMNLLSVGVKGLIVESDLERMNFQNGNRPDMNDASGCEQADGHQQDCTEAEMVHGTSC